MHHSAMPTVSALFSGPVSVGLLAGVVSGLFYLVVAGIRWAGVLIWKPSTSLMMMMMLCSTIESREVKQQSEEWLFRQVQRRLHPTSSDRRLCSTENGVGMEPESVRVREFIESLVESLLSGELDNHMAAQDSPSAAHAALKQLVHQIIQEAMVLPKFNGVKPTEDDMKSLGDMESKTYEDILATAILNKVIERYQQRDSSGRASLDGNSNLLSPELMSLVAMYQPRLLSYSESGVSHMRSSDDYDSIEECIEEVTTFSNADEEENDIDPDSYLPGLDIFKNRRAPFPEYGRDIIDGPPLELSDNEEGEDEVASEDEDSMQPTDIINPVDSWEENWLFQKRRLKVGGVPQPMPVPMLVPNPSEDYRALIGDRDAEDVSDLSDCSDGALEDVVLAEEDTSSIPVTATTPSNVLNTQENVASTLYDNHLSSRKDVNPAKTSEASSEHADKARMIMNEDNKKATYDIRELTEAKNMEYLKSTEDCLSEFGQQEGEYTEDYAAVTRRQMDSLTAMSDLDTTEVPELPSTPIPQLNSDTSTVDESVVAILDGLVPGESDTDQLSLTSLGSIELTKPPRPGTDHLDDEYCTLPAAGTIAEREHKKWETAPPIPNNPYSSENIIKRLNKNHPYIRTDSSSEALMEFLESKEVLAEKVVEQPLQVICSPSDVDFKRYGRDYYINAQPVANSVKKQTSSQPSQQQELSRGNDAQLEVPSINEDSTETQDPNNIETKVALWQKEINETDQYYKNILNKKQEHAQDSPSSDSDHQTDSSSFYKSMLSNGNENHDNDENENNKSKSKNKLRERLREFEKIERNGFDDIEEKSAVFIKTKTDSKLRREAGFEILGTLRRNSNIGSTLSLNENGTDFYSNGYARSESPSGSSVLTSDSDFGMPSVKELTKRFSGVVDSDSSASPKSVSPAPQWRKTEKPQKWGNNEMKMQSQAVPSTLSPPRPVREIHSLTARSISKEFREELRHNQPVPLNKNVYKQMNPKHLNGMDNGIEEENSSSSYTRISSESKSPVPHRSMQSSIAFWEQMQKNKS
ncbi:Uncharacterized protein GBIM_17274 [Gryllus bimaculatus]|nr:Uncharacterized protein GBIM_17274 [Gryllus bimaculatus]